MEKEKYEKTGKVPITHAEVAAFRERLPIGYVIRKTSRDLFGEVRERRLRVVEKYNHFCLLQDDSGIKDTMKYIDMMVEIRKTQLAS